MAEPFLGEIRLASFNIVPRGWLACNGQLLSIEQNTALFAILGTTYGGNGTTNFALPNLQGRAPVHPSNTITQGQTGGEATHTLSASEMPNHSHTVNATTSVGNAAYAAGNLFAEPVNATTAHAEAVPYAALADTPMGKAGVSSVGGVAHENMPPYLALNYIIATTGIFPSHS